jgi:maleamate amidohydrolase
MTQDEEIRELYASKGIGTQRIGFGRRPCIVVVDFARAFTDPSTPLGCDLDQEVQHTAELIALGRTVGVPTFYLTTAYHSQHEDGGWFLKKVPALRMLQMGDPWTDIDPRLDRAPEEIVFTKKYSSGFQGTSLAATLTSMSIDTVIVTGCSTSGCVRATTYDACGNGFRAMVVEECVGDRHPAPHRSNLLDLDAKYADVVSKAETEDYLRSCLNGVAPEPSA